MKDTYNKEEVARILRERPDLLKLLQIALAQPEDRRDNFIEKAIDVLEDGKRGNK